MKLFDTSMAPSRLQRNSDDFAEVRRIADSGNDHPVLMLNMNRYMPDSGFPDRGAYHDYITGLGPFLEGAGARLLWRFPVLGQAVGDQKIDEILACWYPLHRNFLELYEAPGAAENFHRKGVTRSRQAVLGALLDATLPTARRGGPAFRAVQVNEAMNRAYTMIRLTALLEKFVPLDRLDVTAGEAERRIASERRRFALGGCRRRRIDAVLRGTDDGRPRFD